MLHIQINRNVSHARGSRSRPAGNQNFIECYNGARQICNKQYQIESIQCLEPSRAAQEAVTIGNGEPLTKRKLINQLIQ